MLTVPIEAPTFSRDTAFPDIAARHDALRRVLASPDFSKSARLRRFLEYVVGETLAGREDRIKAYAVATDVFGRDEHFDVAKRPGRADRGRAPAEGAAVLLSHGRPPRSDRDRYPEGMLCPDLHGQPPPGRQLAGDKDRRSSVYRSGQGPGNADFFRRSQRCAARAGAQPDQRADGLWRPHQASAARINDDADFPAEGARYLMGSIRAGKDRVRLVCRLTDARSGAVIWSDGFEREVTPEDCFALPEDLAGQIATAIATPRGVIALAQRVCGAVPSPVTALSFLPRRVYAAALPG